MLKIWGRTTSSNVQKVMWAVGELGIAHERIDVGGQYGGLDTVEYGAMNPNRRIPTIQDGSLVLWESNVIVRYLSAKLGEGTLWPRDPGVRGVADQWMDWRPPFSPDMRTSSGASSLAPKSAMRSRSAPRSRREGSPRAG